MSNEEYAAEIQRGHKEYMLPLWKQTERFIGMQAGRYLERLDGCRGIEEDDLKQAGFLALADAADQYDPDGGASFVHYLSFHLHRRFVETAGLRTDKTTADPINSPISLDQPIEDGDGATLGDLQRDPQNVIEEAEERIRNDQLRAELEKALSKLKPADAAAIRLRYFDNMTLMAAAEALGITPQAVRERQAHGLRELRRAPNRKALETYLEIRTPFFMKASRGESPIEKIVLYRERLRNMFSSQQAELQEIRNAAKKYRRLEKA